jgi:hypothetical protein
MKQCGKKCLVKLHQLHASSNFGTPTAKSAGVGLKVRFGVLRMTCAGKGKVKDSEKEKAGRE